MRHPITYTAIAALFTLTLFVAPSALGQVRINEVDYEDQWVELRNTGNATVDVSDYYLCSFPTYEPLSDLTALVGSTSIPAGGFLVVEWTASNFTTSDGEVGLYFNNNNFADASTMADYMQYGTAGHVREGVANDAGVWETGEFVSIDEVPSGKTISFFDVQGEVGEEDWQASNETQGGANQVLPVELVAFDAVADDGTVHLTWSTASETNNAGFEVQHRRGNTFEQIGYVEGHGTTSQPQTYQHTVRNLSPGAHVFRLKQIDFDGAFEYSPEVEVTIDLAATYTLSGIFPNPASKSAAFTLAVRQTQQVDVVMYDVLGRRVATLHDGLLAEGRAHRFSIDGQTLSGGIYLIRMTGEHFSATEQVTVIK